MLFIQLSWDQQDTEFLDVTMLDPVDQLRLGKRIYREKNDPNWSGPGPAVSRIMDDETLKLVVKHLQEHMVLDDLADV